MHPSMRCRLGRETTIVLPGSVPGGAVERIRALPRAAARGRRPMLFQYAGTLRVTGGMPDNDSWMLICVTFLGR